MKLSQALPSAGILAFAVWYAVAVGGCTTDEKSSDSGDSAKDCGSQATGDCTPHVGSRKSVKVDGLVWRIRSVDVTKTLGEQSYGLGAKANGRFVVVKVKVHSTKGKSVTLTDNVMKLEINGNQYDADLDGSVAAIGAGKEAFFLETVGPDSNSSGTVVFDVPASKLKGKVEARFNELGFGDPHGYIRLPVSN